MQRAEETGSPVDRNAALELMRDYVNETFNENDMAVRVISDVSRRTHVPVMQVDPRLIVVDGPIGAGKTTFCNKLCDYVNYSGLSAVVIEEAVGEPDFEKYGISLNDYYQDPRKHAYAFQLAVIEALAAQLYEYRHGSKYRAYDFVILDRWLPSTTNFVLFKTFGDRSITMEEARYLLYLIDTYMQYAGVLPGTYILLDADDDTCAERICRRVDGNAHREAEEGALDLIRQTNAYLRSGDVYPVFFRFHDRQESAGVHDYAGCARARIRKLSQSISRYRISETLYDEDLGTYTLDFCGRRMNAWTFFGHLTLWAEEWFGDVELRRRTLTVGREAFGRAIRRDFPPYPMDGSESED